MRTDTAGTARLCLRHHGDLGGSGPGRGEWGSHHPLARPQEREGAQPSSRSLHSRAGGARAAAGVPRPEMRSGAGSAAAGGSARPRSAGGTGRGRHIRRAAL